MYSDSFVLVHRYETNSERMKLLCSKVHVIQLLFYNIPDTYYVCTISNIIISKNIFISVTLQELKVMITSHWFEN